MASPLSDDRSSTQKEIAKGLKIDSRLIQTAALSSAAVQDDLRGLGVSVYNQLEFEAGVFKQIDDEVQRQTSEQDRKFLLTKHSAIIGEINAVRVGLNDISKTISGLLSLPMASVASRLRELRAAQEQKTKQMNDLQVKEQNILKKLTHRDGPNTVSCDTSRDVPFGIPQASAGGSETEKERLIRMGHLTPFGTRLEEFSETSSSKLPIRDMGIDVGEPSDKQGILAATMSAAVNSAERSSSSVASLVLGKREQKIRLSSDSFNGLFVDDLVEGPSGRKNVRRLARIPKNRNKESNLQPPSTLLPKTDTLEPNYEAPLADQDDSSTLLPKTDTLEPNYEAPLADQDDWVPSLAQLMETSSSSESEYFTDDDMGKMKGKKRLRELSSDGDLTSDDAGTRSRKGGKGKMKGSRKRKKGQLNAGYDDDGDEDVYRQRIQVYQKDKKTEFESSESPDFELIGGFTVPGSIWHRLYRYQQTGVKWLWELHQQQAGGIVGDDMGLGKTIQMIAFLTGLKVSSLRNHVTRKMGLGPVLIVCPATVMHQWVSEFHSWWPPFRVAVLHGTGSFCGSKRHLVDLIVKDNGVLVTTYSSIRLDQDLLLQHKWDYVVLDEGHKIRNPDAEITLACKQVMTSHRLILSGCPMQNNLRELWSLFDFVFPGKLGTLPVFMEQFSLPITIGGYTNATEVQVQTAYKDTINPYMLRRLKADVHIQLPDMNEQVLFCRLTDYQCELYRDYIQGPEVAAMLERGKKVFSGIITLRKLCNHPDLVTNDFSKQVAFETKGTSQSTTEASKEEQDCFDKIMVPSNKKRRSRKKKDGDDGDEGAAVLDEDEDSFGHWRRSGKMNVVEALLSMWKAHDHRVLLFSQSRIMLNILERFIKGRGYNYRRMDGATPISTRQPLVNEFNENNSIFVFLLTTRVGGLGVNLTGADRVILYDPDWNPSTDTQARERAWRIGQTRQVTIYRLITSGTIEEKIYHRQIFKQFLTNRVLKDPRQRRFFKTNNLLDLFTLNSSAVEGNTETSAIFADTGSEILPRSSASRSRRASSRKRKREEESGKGKRKSKLEEPRNGEAADGEPGGSARPSSPSACNDTERKSDGGIVKHDLLDRRRRKKRKRKSRKKEDGRAEIEGEELSGVSRACIYNPGRKDEEEKSKQDDFILQKLFKKTGVHSALQHDAIMNSTDPDYILVEAEASKVSKSASRALKESRRVCLQDGAGHGRPTWTGQHGRAGAPSGPRFGAHLGVNLKSKLNATPIAAPKQQHFSGSSAGGTAIGESGGQTTLGSVNTSSKIFLAKMQQRNTRTSPGREGEGGSGASNAHDFAHGELLVEIRDFIALRGKVNGQATTGEILEQFSKKLPFSDTALFKAMLYEICDFSRYRGDGLWILKQEFR